MGCLIERTFSGDRKWFSLRKDIPTVYVPQTVDLVGVHHLLWAEHPIGRASTVNEDPYFEASGYDHRPTFPPQTFATKRQASSTTVLGPVLRRDAT